VEKDRYCNKKLDRQLEVIVGTVHVVLLSIECQWVFVKKLSSVTMGILEMGDSEFIYLRGL
jgi:hypothetical protein